jgi:uncharacterized protein
MFNITQLFTYPIKSLGGISLDTAKLSATGFDYDRYWMLVDENGKFITQREIPILSLFRLTMSEEHITVKFKNEEIKISKTIDESSEIECILWGDKIAAINETPSISEWFSDMLGTGVRLVRKAESPKRAVRNHPDFFLNFPDGGQYLILGQGALDNLNSKLNDPIPINRFRPNIVFSGGMPHIEDAWRSIQIGDAIFEITKPCERCGIPAINQENGEVGIEPVPTLAKYRRFDNKVLFGQYLKWLGGEGAAISIGDHLQILAEQ